VPFEFKPLEIDGLVLIEPRVFYDDRGFFMESFKDSDFRQNGIDGPFAQDNHSLSKKGVIRGLHYQLDPKAQGKLVRVIRGSVWDVAVDIRRDSPSYKKWLGFELSENNCLMLFIPPGFAHGFAAITDDVHLVYKCTTEYDQKLDAGIRWDDPELAVEWPIANPLVSEKDRVLPFLKDAVVY
jgi:dTDP-4-dehydrorhamnose 3,5-epimerase